MVLGRYRIGGIGLIYLSTPAIKVLNFASINFSERLEFLNSQLFNFANHNYL